MIFEYRNKDIEFPDEIEVAGQIFNIEVEFSKKKNSSVVVKDDILVFRMSSYLSRKQADSHFSDLLKSISKKIEKSPSSSIVKKFSEVLEEGSFNFGGEVYTLTYMTKGRGVKLKENTFFIGPNSKQENIKKNVIKLLQDRYFKRIESYFYTLNEQTYNYTINGFELKLVESKWGHCSHEEVIMINLKLLNAKPEILNYVILHEIAHVKVKNHSDRFWREVEKFCPNHKELRKDLRENPPSMFE